jgi:hypothetical protein
MVDENHSFEIVENSTNKFEADIWRVGSCELSVDCD